jgi:hypothetical protein
LARSRLLPGKAAQSDALRSSWRAKSRMPLGVWRRPRAGGVGEPTEDRRGRRRLRAGEMISGAERPRAKAQVPKSKGSPVAPIARQADHVEGRAGSDLRCLAQLGVDGLASGHAGDGLRRGEDAVHARVSAASDLGREPEEDRGLLSDLGVRRDRSQGRRGAKVHFGRDDRCVVPVAPVPPAGGPQRIGHGGVQGGPSLVGQDGDRLVAVAFDHKDETPGQQRLGGGDPRQERSQERSPGPEAQALQEGTSSPAAHGAPPSTWR